MFTFIILSIWFVLSTVRRLLSFQHFVLLSKRNERERTKVKSLSSFLFPSFSSLCLSCVSSFLLFLSSVFFPLIPYPSLLPFLLFLPERKIRTLSEEKTVQENSTCRTKTQGHRLSASFALPNSMQSLLSPVTSSSSYLLPPRQHDLLVAASPSSALLPILLYHHHSVHRQTEREEACRRTLQEEQERRKETSHRNFT